MSNEHTYSEQLAQLAAALREANDALDSLEASIYRLGEAMLKKDGVK